MAFKTITIKEEVYKKLILMKKKDESFSEMFYRLSRKNIKVLRSMRGNIEFDNKGQMIKELKKKRIEQRYG